MRPASRPKLRRYLPVMPTRGSGRIAYGAAAASVALAGVLVLTSACSNEESATAKRPQSGTGTATAVAGGVQQIVVDTGPDLRFHPSTLVVHPGRVRIVLRNMRMGNSGGPPHNLQVFGVRHAYIPTISQGQSASATFEVDKPGRYRFVCTIHEQQGQTGTLVVRSGA